MNNLKITSATLLSACLPFLIYWTGGGNFERGEALAVITVIAIPSGIIGFSSAYMCFIEHARFKK